MKFVGIDPGAEGALYAVNHIPMTDDTLPAEHLLMPMVDVGKRVREVDVAVVHEWLKEVSADFVVLEDVGYMPAGKSGFKSSGFGEGILTGRVRELVGMLKAVRLRYELVVPRVWQGDLKIKVSKVTGEDREKRKKRVKAAVQDYVRRRYPTATLMLPRGRTVHEGLADALALAHWGACMIPSRPAPV